MSAQEGSDCGNELVVNKTSNLGMPRKRDQVPIWNCKVTATT